MKRILRAAKAIDSKGMRGRSRAAIPLMMALAAPALGACSTSPVETASKAAPAAKEPLEARKRAVTLAKADPRERECLVRAMYFESNRSSETGLLGVGTVVMNRVESQRYPETICGVVGAPRQFAAGVLTRPMAERDLPKIVAIADSILDGKRSAAVGAAKHFHMAGMRFSYANMHYVTVAGGNAFYLKGERPERRRTEEPAYQLAAVSEPAPLATASSTMPTSFATAPLAFAPQTQPIASPAGLASTLVKNAPLPPNRPLDLDMPRKTTRTFVMMPKSDARLAALMPASANLRGSLPLE